MRAAKLRNTLHKQLLGLIMFQSLQIHLAVFDNYNAIASHASINHVINLVCSFVIMLPDLIDLRRLTPTPSHVVKSLKGKMYCVEDCCL